MDAKYVEPKPASISFIEGSAIADSPVNAMLALEDGHFESGERILVLGGSGACGGSIIQISKARGASYIAATSTAGDLVQSLGADRVIDYTCGLEMLVLLSPSCNAFCSPENYYQPRSVHIL